MTTAKQDLEHHRVRLAELEAKSASLTDQIARAQAVVAAGREALATVETAKTHRRTVLAGSYLGTATAAEVKAADDALLAVELEAGAAALKAEGAAAAIELLAAERDGLQAELGRIHRELVGVTHHALLEHATEALPRYRQAVAEMAAAFADLQGRCAAADTLADHSQGRMVTLTSGLVPRFSVTAPTLPGAGSALEWTHDLAAGTAKALEESLAEFAAGDIARATAVARGTAAVAAADAEMARAIAALG